MKNENTDLKKNQLELKELTETLKQQLQEKEQYLIKIQKELVSALNVQEQGEIEMDLPQIQQVKEVVNLDSSNNEDKSFVSFREPLPRNSF